MALDCEHRTAPAAGRACRHLIGREAPKYCVYFPGFGRVYELVCPTCARSERDEDEELGFVCAACFRDIETTGVWHSDEFGITGKPEVALRSTELRFEHEMIRMPDLLTAKIRDIQPIAGHKLPVFVALLADGTLTNIDLVRQTRQEFGEVALELGGSESLIVSSSGRYAAVCDGAQSRGEVWDLEERCVIHEFGRARFEDATEFPCAFVRHGGRDLFVFASEAGKLDALDLEERRIVTQRESRGGDYLHGRLSVSPDGSWIASGGRVPGPCGFVSAWRVRDWLGQNPHESEEGASKKYFGQRWRAWDDEMCWVADGLLAVWGYGPDDACVLPAVALYDVASGNRLTWFPGPAGWLAFDKYLFACCQNSGTQVFDVNTGERLLHDAGFHPQRYHPGARCFVTTRPDGEFFIVSQLK